MSKTKSKILNSRKGVNIFEQDGVARTKLANEIVKNLEEPIAKIWRSLLAQGWKQWEVQILVEHACDATRCWFNLGLDKSQRQN